MSPFPAKERFDLAPNSVALIAACDMLATAKRLGRLPPFETLYRAYVQSSCGESFSEAECKQLFVWVCCEYVESVADLLWRLRTPAQNSWVMGLIVRYGFMLKDMDEGKSSVLRCASLVRDVASYLAHIETAAPLDRAKA